MPTRTGHRVVTFLVALYVLICVAALLFMAIGTQGLFGVQPDGLAAVGALMLAMPWSLGFFATGVESPTAFVVMIVLGMALNSVLIWGVLHLLRRAVVSLMGGPR